MFGVYHRNTATILKIVVAAVFILCASLFTHVEAQAEGGKSEITIIVDSQSYSVDWRENPRIITLNLTSSNFFAVNEIKLYHTGSNDLLIRDEKIKFKCTDGGTHEIGSGNIKVSAHGVTQTNGSKAGDTIYFDSLKNDSELPKGRTAFKFMQATDVSNFARTTRGVSNIEEEPCVKAWREFQLNDTGKGQVEFDRGEIKKNAETTIANEQRLKSVGERLTPLLYDDYYSTWNERAMQLKSKNNTVTEGCATIGGSYSCDKNAFSFMLYKCFESATKNSSVSTQLRGGRNRHNEDIGDAPPKGEINSKLAACISKETYGDDSERDNILGNLKDFDPMLIFQDVRNRIDEANKSPGGDLEDKEKTCSDQVEWVGWIMCPILNGAVAVADWSWAIFEVMLAHNPIHRYDEKGEETSYYKTWSSVRNLANTALVILFLFVIYSQITGYGLTNYGVKQALPRLVAMTILINLSFFGLQVMFDIASVFGATLDKIVTGNITVKPSLSNLLVDIVTAGTLGVAGGAIAFGAVAIAGGTAALIFTALLILPGVIALIAGFFAVLLRNALLPVVAVLAPIALVAYVLPNTRGVFDKWKNMFISLLFLYPVASLYYAALKATALMMLANEDASATLQRLMGFALLLFGSGFVAILAVKSNAIAGKIMGGIQGALTKATSPIEKLGRATMTGAAAERVGAFRAQNFGKKSRFNPMRHIGRGMQAFDRGRRDRELRTALQNSEADQQWRQGLLNNPSRLKGLEGGAGGQGYLSKLEAEAVSNKEVSLRNQDLQALGKTLEEAIKSGDTITARAAQNRLLNSGSAGLETFNGTIANADTSPGGIGATMRESLSSNIRDNHASAMDKDMGTMKWATGGRTMTESQNDAAAELADKGIATEKFAQMTESAQKRLLESSHGGSILNQGQIAALTDQSGQYGGKIGKSVVEKLNKMKAQPIPAPSDPSDSYSI